MLARLSPRADEHGPRVEGSGIVGNGADTVREDQVAVRDAGATVRDTGATVRDTGVTVREEPGQSPPSAGRSREGQAAGWLPESLAADFRILRPLPAQGGEADLYILEPRSTSHATVGESRRVAKIYRHGIAPKADVIERVQAADPAHVVRLEAYGQDADRWWELMEYVERGSLRALIEEEGPRLHGDLVRNILQQLNDALAGLHRLPLEHRDLKPANVLVRTRTPLNLIVTDFAISSVMDASHHFTAAARTIRYAPPESIGTLVADRTARRNMVMIEHTTWDYWSLGMMLVEMLQGEHPYDGLAEIIISNQLVTQNVDQLTEGISDPDWRKLCRGLLRRTPAARWDAEAVSKWLADPGDPSLVVAEETPAAPASTPAATIAFGGARYATPAELGEALSRDWNNARFFWTRRFQDVSTWVIDDLGLGTLGRALAEVADNNAPQDSQVFRFIYLLAPNAPLRFRDLDLSLEGLVALGERAANPGNANAVSSLLALYGQRLLVFAGLLPGQQDLAAVSRRWDEAVADYGRMRHELREHGVAAPEAAGDMLIRLLAASIPGSPLEVRLRAEAQREFTADVRRCSWLRELGTPEEMSVATLCMLPHLLAPARRQGRLARTQRIRGCAAGIVVGGLYGSLVAWAERDFYRNEFSENLGGVVLLTQLIFACVFAVPWYRGGFREVWNRLRDMGASLARWWRSFSDGYNESRWGD